MLSQTRIESVFLKERFRERQNTENGMRWRQSESFELIKRDSGEMTCHFVVFGLKKEKALRPKLISSSFWWKVFLVKGLGIRRAPAN